MSSISITSKIKKFRTFLGEDVWWLFVRAIVLGMIWFAVESTFIIVLQSLLRSLGLISADQGFLNEYLPKTVIGSSLMLIAYGFLRAAVSVFREYYAGVSNQAFIRTQRERIVESALHSANVLTSFDVMSMFGETVNRAGIVVLQMTQFTNIFTSACLLFVLGLKLAPIELLIGVFLLSAFVWPINHLTRKYSMNSALLTEYWHHINKIFHLGFKNNFFLKVHQLVGLEINHAKNSLRKFESEYERYYLTSGIRNSIPVFAGVLVLSVILYVSRTYVGTDGAVLISFFYLFIRISQAASEGNAALSNLRIYWPSFMDLYHWNLAYYRKEGNAISDVSEAKTLSSSTKLQLKMIDVDFAYPSGGAIFSNKNFSLNTGELMLIKGKSGTGKSTLLALLLGVLRPTRGKVTLNDVDLSLASHTFSKMVGYVGAEPFLIPGTVRENLTYGLDVPVSDEAIKQALQDACVLDAVSALPNGLNESLNELTQLSTGQKQRLSIARAYLRNPKVLVWDEATANLDEALEQQCIGNLMKKQKDLIIVIVSHKNSFDERANLRFDL